MKLSIIIPVFNGGLLRHCLNSIKAQTFKDFEVLLIDDGSTDNSAEICNQYVQEDNRFKYFKK